MDKGTCPFTSKHRYFFFIGSVSAIVTKKRVLTKTPVLIHVNIDIDNSTWVSPIIKEKM